jgi:endonuclease/exonuclease/phosphatase (EEP) superfamily protein YafD
VGARAATALCWGLATIWVLWALVRLTGIERGFPLVPLMAYTPYMALAAVLPVAVAVALRRLLPALVAAVAGLYLAFAVLPRGLADGGATEQLGGPTLDVISANIFHGEANEQELVSLVRRRKADLLFVQELAPSSAAALRRAGLTETLPHSVLAIGDRALGGGIYSRLPLRRLSAAPGTELRMPRAIVAVPGYGRLRMVDVHPYPPTGGDTVGLWKSGLRSLPAADRGGPRWLLAGDFNATLDHAELRRVLDSGYRDAAEVQGEGLKGTWSARRSIPPPVAIDHVLVDEQISVTDFAVEDLPATDHHPVFAELSLPRAGQRPGRR